MSETVGQADVRKATSDTQLALREQKERETTRPREEVLHVLGHTERHQHVMNLCLCAPEYLVMLMDLFLYQAICDRGG